MPLPQGCTAPPCEHSPLGHYTAPPHSWAHGMALHPLHWALCPPTALHIPMAVHCTLPCLCCTCPRTLPAPAVALHPPVTALHSPTDNCIACGTTLYPPMAPYCTTAPHCTLPWHRHCAALHILHNRDVTPLQRCRALPHTTMLHPLWHTLCIPPQRYMALHAPCNTALHPRGTALHAPRSNALHAPRGATPHAPLSTALPCPALPWTLPVALHSTLAALQRPARPAPRHRTAPHRAALHCTAPHCTALHRTAHARPARAVPRPHVALPAAPRPLARRLPPTWPPPAPGLRRVAALSQSQGSQRPRPSPLGRVGPPLVRTRRPRGRG